jgi:FtsH-binding integral membrane protein
MYKNITKIALNGIALAMGVAVMVLGTLKTLDVSTGISMLGMGLTALALASFQE